MTKYMKGFTVEDLKRASQAFRDNDMFEIIQKRNAEIKALEAEVKQLRAIIKKLLETKHAQLELVTLRRGIGTATESGVWLEAEAALRGEEK